jgi:hypothetical protein
MISWAGWSKYFLFGTARYEYLLLLSYSTCPVSLWLSSILPVIIHDPDPPNKQINMSSINPSTFLFPTFYSVCCHWRSQVSMRIFLFVLYKAAFTLAKFPHREIFLRGNSANVDVPSLRVIAGWGPLLRPGG